MKVKICGLTESRDVILAAKLGADYCGFVLAPSPRQIDLAQLAKLVRLLPRATKSVAVMVNPLPEDIERALHIVDYVQLHGQETPDSCRPYGKRIWKAFRIRILNDLHHLEDYDSVGAYLLDSFSQAAAGGTGKSFPWAYLEGYKFSKPTFLAGGLNADNITYALKIPFLYGLDVSSGIELNPGHKDKDKMTNFLSRAKAI